MLAFVVGLAGCAGRAAVPLAPPAASPEAPALAALSWLEGTWKGEHGTETWAAVGGALYGVALLDDGGFEVMIVDDGDGPGPPDGVLRFLAMPGGAAPTEFRAEAPDATGITFSNPAHDFPKVIRYERVPDGLLATLEPDGAEPVRFAFAPGEPLDAPELIAADTAFAADTAARGVDGLMAWFAPDGWMFDRAGQPMRGEALRAAWAKRLAAGTLTWAPVASGRAGDVGFTVGHAAFTGADERRDSSYVTIWALQTDGTWKVRFDTGRTVNGAP
jgi:ketosteroid isomerase-like protein